MLRDLSLHVRPGEHVALVGPSGAGKSSLMALVQRFHDPFAGNLRLDGHDLRGLDQKWLRRQIGVVLQDPFLFDDTIRANIAYGAPGASDAQIIEAARSRPLLARLRAQGCACPVTNRPLQRRESRATQIGGSTRML